MPPLIIAQLIIALGPTALNLIQELAQVWHQPTVDPAEVMRICSLSQKSYDQYITEARARLNPIAAPIALPASTIGASALST